MFNDVIGLQLREPLDFAGNGPDTGMVAPPGGRPWILGSSPEFFDLRREKVV